MQSTFIYRKPSNGVVCAPGTVGLWGAEEGCPIRWAQMVAQLCPRISHEAQGEGSGEAWPCSVLPGLGPAAPGGGSLQLAGGGVDLEEALRKPGKLSFPSLPSSPPRLVFFCSLSSAYLLAALIFFPAPSPPTMLLSLFLFPSPSALVCLFFF